MTVIRTRKNGTHYPISGRTGNDKWIQKAMNPEDRGDVREHMLKKYGPEAFHDNDPEKPLKMEYLEKERDIAFARGEHRLGHQVNAAINLKRITRKKDIRTS